MGGTFTRKLAVGLSLMGALVALFFTWQADGVVHRLSRSLAETRRPSSTGPSNPPVSSPNAPPLLVSVDQIVANLKVVDPDSGNMHSAWMRLELELFSDEGKALIEQRRAGIRNVVLDVTHRQEYRSLSTLPGKLYFKELLVARINGFLNAPVVRDIHFSDFLLQ